MDSNPSRTRLRKSAPSEDKALPGTDKLRERLRRAQAAEEVEPDKKKMKVTPQMENKILKNEIKKLKEQVKTADETGEEAITYIDKLTADKTDLKKDLIAQQNINLALSSENKRFKKRIADLEKERAEEGKRAKGLMGRVVIPPSKGGNGEGGSSRPLMIFKKDDEDRREKLLQKAFPKKRARRN